MRKEFNSHRIALNHQHGRLLIVLGEQHGEEVTSCESNLILLNLKYPHNKKKDW